MEGAGYNDRLIDQVRSHSCLYNQDKRALVDSKERQLLWQRIAAAIDPNSSGEFAKKRWLQIRDRYRKELRATMRGELIMGAKWRYFHRLTWLDPHLKNLDVHKSDDDGNCGDHRLDCSASDQSTSSSTINCNQSTAEIKNEQNDAAEIDDDSSNSLPCLNLSLLHSLLSSAPSSDLLNDEFFLFSRIVGLRLKRLHVDDCRRIQSEILNLLYEEEKRNEDDLLQ